MDDLMESSIITATGGLQKLNPLARKKSLPLWKNSLSGNAGDFFPHPDINVIP